MTATGQAVERTYTSSEVLSLTGVKYRFLDHACRAGYLPTEQPEVGNLPGTGHRRLFTEREVDIVYAAQSLINVGFTVAGAFAAARNLTDHDEHRVTAGLIYEVAVTVTRPTEGATE